VVAAQRAQIDLDQRLGDRFRWYPGVGDPDGSAAPDTMTRGAGPETSGVRTHRQDIQRIPARSWPRRDMHGGSHHAVQFPAGAHGRVARGSCHSTEKGSGFSKWAGGEIAAATPARRGGHDGGGGGSEGGQRQCGNGQVEFVRGWGPPRCVSSEGQTEAVGDEKKGADRRDKHSATAIGKLLPGPTAANSADTP
jgi:hypothetical protein